jgi:hypothetical protein
MSIYNGTSTGVQMLAVAQASFVVAEVFLNQRESFRAEVIQRRGKAIVAISRWKKTSGLSRRTGSSIEFAAHRTAGIIGLLSNLQRALDVHVHTGNVQPWRDETAAS